MFRVLKQLSWFFKEQKKRYVIAISLLLVVSIFELTPALLIGRAVDAFQRGALSLSYASTLIVILLAVILISYGLSYIWMRQLFGGAFILERQLRSRFMKHLFQMDPSFYEKRKTGDLLARGTNDMKAISMTAGFGILTLIDSIMFMAIILIAMTWLIDWRLTLAAVAPLPIIAITVTILGNMIHTRFTKAQEAFGDLNDRVLESVAGMRVIRAFRSERKDEAQFENKSLDVYNRYIQVARIESFFDPIITVVVGLSYVIGLGYGAFLVFNQQLTLGQIVTFNIYLGMLIWPMFAIGELVNIMQRGSASYERVNETLSVSKSVSLPSNELVASLPVRLKDYSFSYPNSTVNQLQQIDLTVHKGTTIGIVGKTGSGKSTLVKQFLKYYPPGNEGLLFGNHSANDLSQEAIRQLVGYVPQDHVLLSKTVKENILIAANDTSNTHLHQVIHTAAFDQDLAFLPNGLDTLVGENGVSLSGGQKQRISIARALAKNPELLILDDSLSAVDAKTEARIVENIQRDRSNQTTIITSHRMSAVEHADEIIVLENGTIKERGTHETLLKQGGWYAEQVQNQTSQEKEAMS
ncbi:ABC transporter ATP-binding protein [Shouchella lehensis]|uniref:ABC transporter ATP-binding protein n=1 Tax=Shouchella lehensis TaxID=300825 RepID=A0A4Y7WF30_9BACI|nr:ABC transporter ATP-binding protein [Shouchella lehensis]MBG9784940.1 multidrug ABC transporter ATP-binding protein [Shouchella lehensis]TES46358.1 ABC transporter ATP-binding protein [Shouchella lehensis]